jgi:hypothetical protein
MNWASAKRLRQGDRVFFEYHCFESEQSCHAKLWHHNCQFAKVARRLGRGEVDEAEVGPMFELQFADGFRHHAMSDEIYRRKRPGCKPWRG